MPKSIPISRQDYQSLAQNLSRFRFFQGLAVKDLDEILAQVVMYEYKSGAPVFREGEVADALYIVNTGGVKVTKKRVFLLPSKKVGELGAGSVFGEMAILSNQPRSASVITTEKSTIFVLLRSAVDEMIQSNPTFASHMKRVSAQRNFENKHAA